LSSNEASYSFISFTPSEAITEIVFAISHLAWSNCYKNSASSIDKSSPGARGTSYLRIWHSELKGKGILGT
jgi:hypothetical protein